MVVSIWLFNTSHERRGALTLDDVTTCDLLQGGDVGRVPEALPCATL